MAIKIETRIPGHLVQRVTSSTATYSSTTAVITFDDTIPQNTEGAEIDTVTITPTNASNILRISVYLPVYQTGTNAIYFVVALFQDSIVNAIAARAGGTNNNSGTLHHFLSFSMVHEMTAGTTGNTTFKLRIGTNSAAEPARINGDASRKMGGVSQAVLFVEEMAV